MDPSALVKKQKRELRQQLGLKTGSLGDLERAEQSLQVFKKIKAFARFLRADCVFIYVALPSELNTDRLIEGCFQLGKKVVVPKISDAAAHLMEGCVIHSLSDDLAENDLGFREPRGEDPEIENPQAIDLMIVPGVGFDLRGGRLGRGFGYFDRYLAKCHNAYKLGVAFKEQVIPVVPMEKHDVFLDKVITG